MDGADPVLVVDPDPAWPDQFRALAGPLRRALGEVACRIDHIGSTSVPGLAAKPVIDLQISVLALEPTAPFREPLERLGYRFRPDNEERTKRYFREAPGTRRTHVHVRLAGSWSEQLALLFRDYLRAHPADVARFGEAKRALAQRFRDDRDAYGEAKTPLVWDLLRRADPWSQRVAWSPPPSDG